jgi:MFS family permease
VDPASRGTRQTRRDSFRRAIPGDVHLTLVCVLLLTVSQTMMAVLIPLAASELHLNTTAIGFLVAIPSAVGLLTDIPAAFVSDIVGRRAPIIIGGVIGVVATSMFFAGTLVVIVAAIILFGLAFSLSTVAALAYVTEVAESAEHGRIQGYNGAIQGIGAVVGTGGAGALATYSGTRVSILPAALCLGLAVLVALGLREKRRVTGLHPHRSMLWKPYLQVGRLLRHARLIQMGGSVALMGQFQMLVVENSFLPIYLIATRHYSIAHAGLLLAARSLVGAGLSLKFGTIVDRYGLFRPILIANAVGLAAIALVPITTDSLLIVGLFTLQGVGVAFGAATSNMLITAATTDKDRALGFSSNMFVSRIGGLVFPVLLGTAAQAGGFGVFFVLVGLIGVAMLMTTGLLARRASSQPKSPPSRNKSDR